MTHGSDRSERTYQVQSIDKHATMVCLKWLTDASTKTISTGETIREWNHQENAHFDTITASFSQPGTSYMLRQRHSF